MLLEHLDVDELDRIIGVLYELVERWFQVAIGIGFRRALTDTVITLELVKMSEKVL